MKLCIAQQASLTCSPLEILCYSKTVAALTYTSGNDTAVLMCHAVINIQLQSRGAPEINLKFSLSRLIIKTAFLTAECKTLHGERPQKPTCGQAAAPAAAASVSDCLRSCKLPSAVSAQPESGL